MIPQTPNVWSWSLTVGTLSFSLSGASHCQELFILWGSLTVGRLLIVGSFSLLGGSHVGSLSLSWGSHCQEFFAAGRSRCRECSGSFVVKYDPLNPSSYPFKISSYLRHTFVIPLFEQHWYDTKMISYTWQRCHKIQHSEMRFARRFMYFVC